MNNFSHETLAINDSTIPALPKEDFVEYQAAVLLSKIWPPFVLLLGGFGNIATVFVMRRIKDRNSTQHAFFIALAVSDISLLYAGALRLWLVTLFHVDIRVLHDVVCKLNRFIVFSTGSISAWLVTSVTIQRTIAIKWPHKMKLICTLRRTWMVIAGLVLANLALYSQSVPGNAIIDNVCAPTPEYAAFYGQVFTLLDMFLSSLIPSLCQLVCDVLLSWTLFKASASVTVHTVSKESAENVQDKRKKTASRTTVMILALSCAFLVLTLPVNVCIVWYNYILAQEGQSPRLSAIKELLYSVTFMMWYANSAVNFLLYCFTGTRFRREFVNWIHCRSQHPPSAASE